MTKPRNQSDIINVGGDAYIEAGILKRYTKVSTSGSTSDYVAADLVLSGSLQDNIDNMVPISGGHMSGP